MEGLALTRRGQGCHDSDRTFAGRDPTFFFACVGNEAHGILLINWPLSAACALERVGMRVFLTSHSYKRSFALRVYCVGFGGFCFRPPFAWG